MAITITTNSTKCMVVDNNERTKWTPIGVTSLGFWDYSCFWNCWECAWTYPKWLPISNTDGNSWIRTQHQIFKLWVHSLQLGPNVTNKWHAYPTDDKCFIKIDEIIFFLTIGIGVLIVQPSKMAVPVFLLISKSFVNIQPCCGIVKKLWKFYQGVQIIKLWIYKNSNINHMRACEKHGWIIQLINVS